VWHYRIEYCMSCHTSSTFISCTNSSMFLSATIRVLTTQLYSPYVTLLCSPRTKCHNILFVYNNTMLDTLLVSKLGILASLGLSMLCCEWQLVLPNVIRVQSTYNSYSSQSLFLSSDPGYHVIIRVQSAYNIYSSQSLFMSSDPGYPLYYVIIYC